VPKTFHFRQWRGLCGDNQKRNALLSLILCLLQYASRQLLRLAVALFSVAENSGKATETMEMRLMYARPFKLFYQHRVAQPAKIIFTLNFCVNHFLSLNGTSVW
jgi:hypothetical protein